MHVTRINQALPYEAPGHQGMHMRRIQGREAGPADTVWMGVSIIEPGGGTTATASAVEKFYLVLDGELEVTAELGDAKETAVLARHDSCRIAPGESRQLHNRSALPCAVLLVMPNA
ncbi:cupin domain-containing protein [Variovorax terrae]|uniref:Cupin domain-containing protein n=1 Tax=Variovorax terrae TaxID=2923278 RepID=A0A9X1W036_9BURK|nr:cupin domain-containing protein [Variovorax terrae]MCJ0763628.1 cupin domain-containing protein [Variovorax terrae]